MNKNTSKCKSFMRVTSVQQHQIRSKMLTSSNKMTCISYKFGLPANQSTKGAQICWFCFFFLVVVRSKEVHHLQKHKLPVDSSIIYFFSWPKVRTKKKHPRKLSARWKNKIRIEIEVEVVANERSKK